MQGTKNVRYSPKVKASHCFALKIFQGGAFEPPTRLRTPCIAGAVGAATQVVCLVFFRRVQAEQS